MRNVSRAWCYETGILVGQKVGPELPYSDFYEYFGPDYELDVKPSNMENLNSREYLEKIKTQVLSNLERTRHTPSVQMSDVGRGTTEHQEEQESMMDDLEEDTVGMDRRQTQRQWERSVQKEGELSDSEDEEMADAIGVRKNGHDGKPRRRNHHNFKEAGATDSAIGSPQPEASTATSDAGAPAAVAEGPLGYQGEHDEELEAMAREEDGDGDVEMGDEEVAAEVVTEQKDEDAMEVEASDKVESRDGVKPDEHPVETVVQSEVREESAPPAAVTMPVVPTATDTPEPPVSPLAADKPRESPEAQTDDKP